MITQWLIVLFPLIGLFLIARTLRNYHKAQKATSWPTVTGKIQRSSVVVRGSEDETYKPEIVYEYQVNGKSYVGDVWRIGFEASSMVREKSEFAVFTYPAGQTVTVYVNPDRPWESVLEPGETGWASAWLGVFWLVVGLCVLFGYSPE